mgnify:CR=1 FL=1
MSRPRGRAARCGIDHFPEHVELTPEEQATWRALTSLLVRLPAALDAQLRRDAGITHFDYQVLSQLSEQPERRLRLRELAVRAEEHFGVRVDADTLDPASTVGEMAAFFSDNTR